MSNENGSKVFQFIAAMAGNLAMIAAGSLFGWTSSMLRKLKKDNPVAEDNPLGYAISSDAGSWITSAILPGTIIGRFFFGYLAQRWGRKKTLLLVVIPFTISWIMIGTGTSIEILCIARFIGGLANGASSSVLSMYNVEIAETSIRGALGTLMHAFSNTGWLFSNCIGPYTSYTFVCVACSILPMIFFIFFLSMPESPYYLAAQGKHEEVINVLAKLRGKNVEAVKAEALEIQATYEEASKNDTTFMDLFRVKTNAKALFFSCALFVFQVFTGIDAIHSYAGSIFDDAGTSQYISPAISTIIVGIVQLVASFITPLVVDRLGRKFLLIFSGIGATMCHITLGLYFYLKQRADEGNGDVSSIGWLPLVSLMTFIAVYSVGWGPIPVAVMGEMFTSDIKSKAFGIATLVLEPMVFIVVKLFPNIVDIFGMHNAFWLFAVMSLFGVFFTIFVIPETKGKSLQEIQAELAGDFRANLVKKIHVPLLEFREHV